MHQGNEVFSNLSRGRFCLCAAVLAINKLQKLENPTSHDIDAILFEGDVSNQKIINLLLEQNGAHRHSYLAFSDLPAQIETSNDQFACELHEADLHA